MCGKRSWLGLSPGGGQQLAGRQGAGPKRRLVPGGQPLLASALPDYKCAATYPGPTDAVSPLLPMCW
jgi:hypothetical protein